MTIQVKRIYDEPAAQDGYRVLVDRLWPRGLSKEKARVDEWRRDDAPSHALRKAYHSGALGWGEFRRAYLAEVKEHRDALRELAARARKQRVTLLYASTDAEHNHAVILKQYLERLGGE
jgi:uncharacterized protein YeaO (DUF488 family)